MRNTGLSFVLILVALLSSCNDTKSYLEGKWKVDTSIHIAVYNDNECHLAVTRLVPQIVEFTGSGNVIATYSGDTSSTIPTYGITNDSLIVMGKRPVMDGEVAERFAFFVYEEGDTCRLVSLRDSIVLSRVK